MNLKQAKVKKEEYAFLKGYTIKQISDVEKEFIPINKVVIAPKNLTDFTNNFEKYFDNSNPMDLPSNMDYDIYLFTSNTRSELFVRLEDAISDYNIITTYSQHLQYLKDLYEKAYIACEKAKERLAEESNHTTVFLDKKLHDDVIELEAIKIEKYNKVLEFNLYIEKNIPNPKAEIVTGLRLDEFFLLQ